MQKALEEMLKPEFFEIRPITLLRRYARYIEYRTEKDAFPVQSILHYTILAASRLERIIKKHKPAKEKQKQAPPKRRRTDIPRARLFRVLPESQYGSPLVVREKALFDSYTQSAHYARLEDYLTRVEQREAFSVVARGRAPLRGHYGGRGPVAAMHTDGSRATVTIDTHFERHIEAMERGNRAYQDDRLEQLRTGLSRQERIAALELYALDHEHGHVHQKKQMRAGYAEMALERDNEYTLGKFYARMAEQHKGTKAGLKYEYLREITARRYNNVEQNYGANRLYRAAARPANN